MKRYAARTNVNRLTLPVCVCVSLYECRCPGVAGREWEAASVTAFSSLSASACALTVQSERISLRLPDSGVRKYCAMFRAFAVYSKLIGLLTS